jgi:hypothetical protein
VVHFLPWKGFLSRFLICSIFYEVFDLSVFV